MGPYLHVEVESTGQDAGHVEVVGPLRIAEGVGVKIERASPNGWDELGSGDVMTLKDDAATGMQKFRVTWRDVTFMNRWQVRLGADSGDVARFNVTSSGNIQRVSVSIQN